MTPSSRFLTNVDTKEKSGKPSLMLQLSPSYCRWPDGFFFFSLQRAKEGFSGCKGGLYIEERISPLMQVGQEGHQTVGDSSPMSELACSRNSGLCNACRSEKLASTSLDARVSVGVHMVDADTTSTSVGIDANMAFGQNSKISRNLVHLIPIYVIHMYYHVHTTNISFIH
ncbi:hypothetical protein Taro_028273 [Colocasia esculenta]|uniref:Uncharacterized protein n=1 Tax=Colocasia esculenta TaxID=4460 RepID=A0A843VKL7_COLES|nr:hypothetical protein [Colocasia esculenta]